MTRRVVVVGTGTGVGKTWVASTLARALQRRCSVVGLKPVETGIDEAVGGGPSGHPPDAKLLADASTEIATPAPYRFAPPVSPHLAARRAGTAIDLGRILTYVQHHESSLGAFDVTVVETAGGLFTPLGAELTNFDVARALEPACWILVAPDSLGVLHDVSATVGLARRLGRVPDFVVLSAARPPDASTGTNAAELVTLGIVEHALTLARDATEPLEEVVAAVETAREDLNFVALRRHQAAPASPGSARSVWRNHPSQKQPALVSPAVSFGECQHTPIEICPCQGPLPRS